MKTVKCNFVSWIFLVIICAFLTFVLTTFWLPNENQEETLRKLDRKSSVFENNNINLAPNNTASNILKLENTVWERQEVLDSKSTIIVKWNVTEDDITMLVLGKTTGAIAIGFSYKSTYEADIVIGWIEDEKVFVEDYHLNVNGNLELDDHQDYEAVQGEKNTTHTVFIFRRKLNTCDKFDIEITASNIHLHWNLFQDHHTFSSSWSNYTPITLLDKIYQKPKENLQTYDFVIGNISAASHSETYYICKFWNIPNFGRMHHIVGLVLVPFLLIICSTLYIMKRTIIVTETTGKNLETPQRFHLEQLGTNTEFEKIIDPRSQGLIHHMLLFKCDFETPIESGTVSCLGMTGLLIARTCNVWIAGGTSSDKKDIFYPPHIGSEFGSSNNKPMVFFMEIHFNLPRKNYVLNDNSGIRLYHTDKLRPYSTDFFKVGIESLQIIPPKMKELSNIGLCSRDCTQALFPQDGVRIVGYFMHSHHRAKKLKMHHIRNGVELSTIIENNYDFEYQTFRYLQNEIQVLPNDTLAIECVFDTTKEDKITVYGFSSKEEMCEIFLQVYPSTGIYKCISSVNPQNIVNIFDYQYDRLKSDSYVKFIWRILTLLGFDFYFDKLNPKEIDPKEIQRNYLHGIHDALCQHTKGTIVNSHKFEDYTPLQEPDKCSS